MEDLAAAAADPVVPTEVPVDRISDLPEALLLAILSFLPTHHAVRTSLLSRRFRNLWSASPSLHFDRAKFSVTSRFVRMVDRALCGRDPSAPLQSVRFDSKYFTRQCLLPLKNVLRWIRALDNLGVRDLGLVFSAETVVLVCCDIFAIESLEYLRISTSQFYGQVAALPTNIACTRLRKLYAWVNLSSSDLIRLVGGLPVLEDLELRGIDQDTIDISSLSVKKLTLHCRANKMKLCFPNLDFLQLLFRLGNLTQFHGTMPVVSVAKLFLDSPLEGSMPVFASILSSIANVARLHLSIEVRTGHLKSYLKCCDMQVSLPRLKHLKFSCYAAYVSMFQVDLPLLRKAELRLSDAREEFVPPICNLLKCVEKVADLKLHIGDHWAQSKPFHILEPNKKPPLFPHLVNIGIFTSCHQATIEDVISLLESSPVLNCLQMGHTDPYISDSNQDKKKSYWQSKLPRNSEGNYQHARFTDLHHGNEKNRVIKLLLRRLTSKKRKTMESGSTDQD